MPIDGDKSPLRAAGIDPEHRRRRGVDHPKPDAATALDLHDLGVGEGAVIGEIGVPVIVIQVHGHAAHAHHPVHSRHVAHHPTHGAVAQRAMIHAGHSAHASHGHALLGRRTGICAMTRTVPAAMATADVRENLFR